MIALNDLYNLASAASNLRLNVARDVTKMPKYLQPLNRSIDASLRVASLTFVTSHFQLGPILRQFD